MARLARADVFDPTEVSVFHCINRCVRRCFLCGHDPLTGKNYEHRKQWLEDRLRELAALLGIDVIAFAILSNHFHLVLRNRPDVVATWSDGEVARRWLLLCPLRKTAAGGAEEPTAEEIGTVANVPERLAEIRWRLSDISWFMRLVSEPLARRSNGEDQVSGRFWQGSLPVGEAVRRGRDSGVQHVCGSEFNPGGAGPDAGDERPHVGSAAHPGAAGGDGCSRIGICPRGTRLIISGAARRLAYADPFERRVVTRRSAAEHFAGAVQRQGRPAAFAGRVPGTA